MEPETHSTYNCIVVLGPTASGKTRLGVRLAHLLGGEIISADSRQVYRGLNIGSGKDLEEYDIEGVHIPYHLIDVVDLAHEFSVFEYQKRFIEAFLDIRKRNALPVIAGGTGLYLDAVLSGYRMVEAPPDPALREELATQSFEALAARLRSLKPKLHNVTDLENRERVVRAIEIALYSQDHEPEPMPPVHALILGTAWERRVLRLRIKKRLEERLDGGMIEEVEQLHASGVPWERLEQLGLEYRHVAQFLQGEIRTRNDLLQKLHSAICQFAKRQETWFRRMERKGAEICWIPDADFAQAMAAIRRQMGPAGTE